MYRVGRQLVVWFCWRACCNRTAQALNLKTPDPCKIWAFLIHEGTSWGFKGVGDKTFIQKRAISVFLVEFRAEFQSKILALITFNPKIWLKWDLISCVINMFKWNIAVSVWIGPTFSCFSPAYSHSDADVLNQSLLEANIATEVCLTVLDTLSIFIMGFKVALT